jgi:hypothetical protein
MTRGFDGEGTQFGFRAGIGGIFERVQRVVLRAGVGPALRRSRLRRRCKARRYNGFALFQESCE